MPSVNLPPVASHAVMACCASACGWRGNVGVTAVPMWRPGTALPAIAAAMTASSPKMLAIHVESNPSASDRSAPAPTSARLLVLATNTWNAYNDVGGRNYYTGAVRLSFERPLPFGMLAKPSGHGERLVDGGRAYVEFADAHGLSQWHGMAGWAGQERRFAVWSERAGLDLDYATNVDLHERPSLLDGYDTYLSVGHDEYWSWEMRDHVDAFIDGGGRVAFLS